MKNKMILPVLLAGLMSLNVANAANTRPIANAQTINTPSGKSIDIALQGTDADNDDLSYQIIRKPRKGKLINIADNKFSYTPTPTLGLIQIDAITVVL